jgi:aspartate dehydrogenase
MLNVLVIGLGAIGREILRTLREDPGIVITHVLARSATMDPCTRELLGNARLVASVAEVAPLPDFAVECASAAAVREHVTELLRLGVDVAISSSGAFVDDDITAAVQRAAHEGGSTAYLLAGAVAGLDALCAASLGVLSSVVLTSRKSPRSWRDTAAEHTCDLANLTVPTVVFHGSAREAARLFPKNANSAATVALAGIGLDSTIVTLIADPTTSDNSHEIQVVGHFGEMRSITHNRPMASNPKTSALAALSGVRAIRNRAAAIRI